MFANAVVLFFASLTLHGQAQRLREMAGDVPEVAEGGDENAQAAARLEDDFGVIEMREEDEVVGSLADAMAANAESLEDAPEKVANIERVTRPRLTKYERTRIIGTRATQIAMGAAAMVEALDETDPLRIAEKELNEYRVPLIIRRYLPDGNFEEWKVSEFNPANIVAGARQAGM